MKCIAAAAMTTDIVSPCSSVLCVRVLGGFVDDFTAVPVRIANHIGRPPGRPCSRTYHIAPSIPTDDELLAGVAGVELVLPGGATR